MAGTVDFNVVGNDVYHVECFVCSDCDRPIVEEKKCRICIEKSPPKSINNPGDTMHNIPGYDTLMEQGIAEPGDTGGI